MPSVPAGRGTGVRQPAVLIQRNIEAELGGFCGGEVATDDTGRFSAGGDRLMVAAIRAGAAPKERQENSP